MPGDEAGWREVRRSVGLAPLEARFHVEPASARDELGTVHDGIDRATGRPVQVRILAPCYRDHDAWLQAVEDPARWVGFEHPSLSAPLASGRLVGKHAVVYPRPRGRPIDELPTLERGRALALTRRIADALAAAHGRGLAHGDLRPQAIRVDGDAVVLHDAGLARLRCLAAGYDQLGLCFGHPFYASPEAVGRARRPSPACDVYALGILLYELLWGPPYLGTPEELVRQHRESPLPRPPGEVPIPLGRLLIHLTAKDPRVRLQDALSAARALAALSGAPATPTRVQPAIPRPAPRPERWSSDVIMLAKAFAVDLTDAGETTGSLPRTPDSAVRLKAVDSSGQHPAMPAAADSGRLGVEGERDAGLELGTQIGRGPVGNTYLATWNGQRLVAKVISRRFAGHAWIVERLIARAKRACELEHPSLVHALEVVRHRGRDVLLQELIEGTSLRRRLTDGGPLPLLEALSFTADLLGALCAAAEHGLSHGDIRPEKVLIDREGEARLADLGLAEPACLGASFGSVGLRFGHPAYQAPEVVQERQEDPTPQGDVYMVGVLLHEMLTGARPFQDADPRRLLIRHLEELLPPPADPTRMPSPLPEMIAWLTAKSPTARPTLEEALERVRAVRSEHELEMTGLKVEQFSPDSSLGEEDWNSFTREVSSKAGPPPTRTSSRAVPPAARPAPARRARRGPMATPVLGLVGVIALLVWMARSGAPTADAAKAAEPVAPRRAAPAPLPGPGDPAAGTPRPPPPPPAATPGQTDPARALSAVVEAVEARLVKGELQAAKDELRAAPTPVLVSAEGRARLRELEERILAEGRRRAEADLASPLSLASAGRAGEAEQALREVEQRYRGIVDLERLPTWTNTRREIDRARAMADREVAALGPPQSGLDPGEVHAALAARLHGWRPPAQAALYPRGGLVLRYADPRVLSSDLEWRGAPGARDDARLASREGAPASCSLPLPLERPLLISLEVAVEEASSGAALALLCGADQVTGKAVGLDWGGRLVRLADGRLSGAGQPAFAGAGGSLRLLLRVAPGEGADHVLLSGEVTPPGSGGLGATLAPTRVAVAGVRGRAALHLEGNARVRVLSLEVRGLVDPAGLR